MEKKEKRKGEKKKRKTVQCNNSDYKNKLNKCRIPVSIEQQ